MTLCRFMKIVMTKTDLQLMNLGLFCRYLPNYPEGVSIKMPALDDTLAVLKHYLHKCSEVSSHD